MLAWKDGQPFSNCYGDVYFSTDSGLEETRHVFLQGNRLAEHFAALNADENFCIGETGFGTGLNFLCAWQMFEQLAPQGTSLDFFSVEKFPLSDDELRAALALWPELQAHTEVLLARWKRRVPGWNRWSFAGGRVRLTLAIGDVAEVLPQLPAACVDAWFLDGFSPAKNPEMWSDVVLASLARASRDGATLATYTSAGWVRRGLQQAGFDVERTPGYGRKREMMQGNLHPIHASIHLATQGTDETTSQSTKPACGQVAGYQHERNVGRPFVPSRRSRIEGSSPGSRCAERIFPRTALVIGAGIAGCTAAHALAQRGIAVTLIDSALQLASAASGNPRGILHARFGAGDNPLHRFVLAAYGHALNLLDDVLPVDDVVRAECGLLQLACNSVEQKRIARLGEQEWPAQLLQFVDAAQATQLAGVEMQYGGLWFPAGGWVVPPALCAKLVSHAQITQRLGYEVADLEKTESGWRVSGEDTQGKAWNEEAEIVLVCCAHSAKKLEQFAHFPLTPVRGQITVVPETISSKPLQAVVCGDGYCAPAVECMHVTGATHAFDDEATEVRDEDHAENLARLAEYAPGLHEALSKDVGWAHRAHAGIIEDRNGEQFAAHPASLSGRASVRCSAPGSMPLVGEVQQGLYCSLAHGTRGLLTAGIAGEVLAAQICGQLPPLPLSIIAALAPLPRVRHQG